jgi:hypothetical protein
LLRRHRERRLLVNRPAIGRHVKNDGAYDWRRPGNDRHHRLRQNESDADQRGGYQRDQSRRNRQPAPWWVRRTSFLFGLRNRAVLGFCALALTAQAILVWPVRFWSRAKDGFRNRGLAGPALFANDRRFGNSLRRFRIDHRGRGDDSWAWQSVRGDAQAPRELESQRIGGAHPHGDPIIVDGVLERPELARRKQQRTVDRDDEVDSAPAVCRFAQPAHNVRQCLVGCDDDGRIALSHRRPGSNRGRAT